MTGHVFVVPGTLQSLVYDDVLISTDYHGGVGAHFWPVFGWTEAEGAARHRQLPRLTADHRVERVPPMEGVDDGVRRWLVAVGADFGEPVSWLLDGARQALAAVAEAGATEPQLGRPRRVAMPVMGVGRGGFNGERGLVIHGLLEVAQDAADRLGLDVVLVAANPSDYSALQSLRAADHGRPLEAARETQAERLGQLARAGQLAVFMGAGTGVAAGLPTWSGLLTVLAERVELETGTGFSDLGPLDAAELLRRAAERREQELPESERRKNPLGAHVAEAIGRPARYALSHALLAALDADQVITTNFDRLYETAVREIRKEEMLVVLPDSKSDELGNELGRRPWLLKLHGDVERPESIVLDRRSFVRYDATRRPLGGVLQTTLLTKHLLVVGASMTDDNVIRLVHEVAELTEDPSAAPRALGTVLSLRADPVRAQLWDPEFQYVDLGNDVGDVIAAGRELEIFLDRVAMLSASRTAHLLDPRYRELLSTDEEREVAERFSSLAADLAKLPAEARQRAGWDEAIRLLGRLGA
ncbi:SIR2 family protein [Blastococcus sp. SYSU D00813]